MANKIITLCADDFGYTPGICEGILKLVQLQRLSAVSCMVNQPAFHHYAEELGQLSSQVRVGLHLTLTEGQLLSSPQRRGTSLWQWLLKTHLGLVSSTWIEQELNAQLDQFIQSMGCFPDFIDGHQHVHQLPVIRTLLLKLYHQRLKEYNVAVRATYPAITTSAYHAKAKILAITGGRALQRALTRHKIAHHDCFAGIYDFTVQDYRSLFCQWLHLVPNNTLIMCHPGEKRWNADPIATARLLEMAYFSSDAFLEDCFQYKISLEHLT